MPQLTDEDGVLSHVLPGVLRQEGCSEANAWGCSADGAKWDPCSLCGQCLLFSEFEGKDKNITPV